MKPIPNWNNIQESEERVQLLPGIYPLVITKVVDVPEKEYFEIYFDITKGEFKDYFKNISERAGKDLSREIRSYKQSALSFFKAFITAVEKSNKNYVWNWDENSLVGKNVVGIFGDEEYIKEGQVKIACKLQEFRSAEAWNKGILQIPMLKKLPANLTTTSGEIASKATQAQAFDDFDDLF